MTELVSHWTDFHEISIFSRKSVEKIQVSLNSDRKMGTLHEDLCTFMITSRSFLLIMRNVSDKRYKINHNSHFIFSNSFFFNHAINDIMWKNIVEPARPEIKIWRMRIASWITKATNTNTDCVIIIAFSL